jgi:hypothetical protein
MDDECAAMVDAALVAVTDGQGIYPESAVWADPDLTQAAEHMRDLAQNPQRRAELAARAHARLAEQPSAAAFGEAYAAMLRIDPKASVTEEPFFAGLDAARHRTRRWLPRRLHRSVAVLTAWPDSARSRRS